jgi:hypothetical protein
MALPKRFQKVLMSLMFSSAEHHDRFCSKPMPQAKRPSSPIRTDALFAVSSAVGIFSRVFGLVALVPRAGSFRLASPDTGLHLWP